MLCRGSSSGVAGRDWSGGKVMGDKGPKNAQKNKKQKEAKKSAKAAKK
jgi:hypothetical protein